MSQPANGGSNVPTNTGYAPPNVAPQQFSPMVRKNVRIMTHSLEMPPHMMFAPPGMIGYPPQMPVPGMYPPQMPFTAPAPNVFAQPIISPSTNIAPLSPGSQDSAKKSHAPGSSQQSKPTQVRNYVLKDLPFN
jgi:hypothetical protein